MSKAPEWIYLDGDVEAGDGMFPRCFENPKYASEPQVEYVRVDLAEAAEQQGYASAIEDARKLHEARIEELEADLEYWKKDSADAWDKCEDYRAKLAKAVGLLEAWINVAKHCSIEVGVCCCGDSMDTHAEPMDCGHSPVDHGAYIANGWVEETNATLAELTGGKDE